MLLPIGQDAAVRRFLGPLMTVDDVQELVDGQILNQSIFGHCFWALERRSDHVLLGFCGINRGDTGTPLDGKIEIGWWLASQCWGQGYAREAAELTLAWTWGNLLDDSVWSTTVQANERSSGLMKRLGMVYHPDLDFVHPAWRDFPHAFGADQIYSIERPA